MLPIMLMESHSLKLAGAETLHLPQEDLDDPVSLKPLVLRNLFSRSKKYIYIYTYNNALVYEQSFYSFFFAVYISRTHGEHVFKPAVELTQQVFLMLPD